MLIGDEVNQDFVNNMPQYKDAEVTSDILVEVALQQQAANQMEAIDKVNDMKKDYGNGASTLVIIFNATGEVMNFQQSYDWSGQTDKSPIDQTIGNGQFSVFLHVKYWPFTGSVGCVIYRGESKDFLLSWDNPYMGGNAIRADIQSFDYWPKEQDWSTVESLLEDSQAVVNVYDGSLYSIYSSIGAMGTSPIACFTIKKGSTM